MTQIDSYKHLDEEKAFDLKISLNMEEVAKKCCAQNYGAHRLLSSMVHELRRKTELLNDEWNKREENQDELSPYHSELADGIEKLLNQGFYA